MDNINTEGVMSRLVGKGVASHCEAPRVLRIQSMGRNRESIPVGHSRAGGNPVFCSWVSSLALLAWNNGLVVFVMPAKAVIQREVVRVGHFVSEQRGEAISARNKDCFATSLFLTGFPVSDS
jgi:hypothetical protein